ncbi:hypothetical protein [Oceanobacillus rekensis]|uniref:hypothetical protein n=1 Tax=Oceanobacillus rekensis TaxID=937927 RepID=UPI000B4301D6|nr:hypothetical protein [Oceanobacillus rekensis]
MSANDLDNGPRRDYCEFTFCHRNDVSRYTSFFMTNKQIIFTDSTFEPIVFADVSKVTVEEEGVLLLEGNLHQDNQVVRKVRLNFFAQNSIKEKVILLINKKSVSAKLIMTNGTTQKEFPVEIIDDEDVLSVSITSLKRKILIINKEDKLFKSKRVLLIFNSDGYPYYLEFENKIPLDLSNYNVSENAYFHSFCDIYGTMGAEKFDDNGLSILLDSEMIYIINNYFEIFSFTYPQLKIVNRNKDSMIFQVSSTSGEISYVTFSRVPEKLVSLLPPMEEQDSLIRVNHNPYMLTYEDNEIGFYQSRDTKLYIPYKDIESIDVIDNKDSDYVTVQLELRENSIPISHTKTMAGADTEEMLDGISILNQFVSKENINIKPPQLQKMLKNVYIKKKYPLVQEASVTELYSSWSRQINDFLLYNLFGQLVLLKNGIRKIQENTQTSDDTKNRQILNYMYYTIRGQKRQLDRVSIQFPQMLWNEEQRLIDKSDEETYEQLQRQLLSISGQMQRHFVEIEIALNALSFAIIPKEKFDNTKAKKKMGYIGAGALGVLGVATGGIALVAAGAFTAFNTYSSNESHKDQEQYNEENERIRIDFYINKALDSFNHIMETMLPYYVNQISKVYFLAARHQSKGLKDLTEVDKAKNKMAIFNRLADFYVMKQLPMEQGDLTNTESIIQLLFEIPDTNERKLLEPITD